MSETITWKFDYFYPEKIETRFHSLAVFYLFSFLRRIHCFDFVVHRYRNIVLVYTLYTVKFSCTYCIYSNQLTIYYLFHNLFQHLHISRINITINMQYVLLLYCLVASSVPYTESCKAILTLRHLFLTFRGPFLKFWTERHWSYPPAFLGSAILCNA